MKHLASVSRVRWQRYTGVAMAFAWLAVAALAIPPESGAAATPPLAPVAASVATAPDAAPADDGSADATADQNAAAPAFGGSVLMGSLYGTPGLWSAQFAETLGPGQASAGVYVQRYSRNPGAMVFTDMQSGWTVGITDRLELSFSTTVGRRLRVNSPEELTYYPNKNLANVNPLAPFAYQPLQWGPVGWSVGLTGNLLSQARGNSLGVALQFTAEIPYVQDSNRVRFYGVDTGEPVFTGNLLMDKWLGNAGEIVGNIGISHGTQLDESGITPVSFGSNVVWSYGVVFPRQARIEGIVELNGDVPFGGDEDINYFGPTTPIDSTWGVRLFTNDWIALNAAYRLADHTPHANSSGFVFGVSFGPPASRPAPPPPPPAPPTMTCSADPAVVAPGTAVHVTGTATPEGPAYTYSWTATGGRITPSGGTATWDSTGAAPGMYTISGHVDNGSGGGGSCSAQVEVREPPRHPPTATCSGNPASVQPGATVSLNVQASSPDQRPLTYAWQTSAGRLSSPDQATASLDTTGTSGTVNASVTVTDDRGLSCNCATNIAIQQPPPPPQANMANSLQFKPDSSRVDNAAKAALDDIALRLQQDAGASAVIVGFASTTETPGRRRPISDAAATRLAEQRAVNAKDYLVRQKGIAADRITLREDTSSPGKADVWIVPQGATYNGSGQTFDENAIKPARGRG